MIGFSLSSTSSPASCVVCFLTAAMSSRTTSNCVIKSPGISHAPPSFFVFAFSSVNFLNNLFHSPSASFSLTCSWMRALSPIATAFTNGAASCRSSSASASASVYFSPSALASAVLSVDARFPVIIFSFISAFLVSIVSFASAIVFNTYSWYAPSNSSSSSPSVGSRPRSSAAESKALTIDMILLHLILFIIMRAALYLIRKFLPKSSVMRDFSADSPSV
mmetsp:Transcript_61510/g.137048  ORF Transcript_61510/g.137048 Transcript_61510/m.137048 type:complete len:220 (-) Transcript_61510:10-669(-)